MPTITEYLDTTGHAAGLVTRVTLQAKQTHRVSVFIDDEFAFGLDGEVAVSGILPSWFSEDKVIAKIKQVPGVRSVKADLENNPVDLNFGT